MYHYNKMRKYNSIIRATDFYQEEINKKSMTNHIINVLKDSQDKNMEVAPYCYFQPTVLDYEFKSGRKYSDEPMKFTEYGIPTINLQDDDDLKKYLVPEFKKFLPKNKSVCGLIGVPMPDGGDHYVSYIFDKKDKILYYFDSAIDKDYKEVETFKILTYTFEPNKVVKNSKTFETAGGADDSKYSYISQNIFCHSWSLWFLYQMLVEKRDMKSINRMGTSKESEMDYNNLVRIKKFVYKTLIKLLQLNYLYDDSKFDDHFRYIILDNDRNKTLEIIKR